MLMKKYTEILDPSTYNHKKIVAVILNYRTPEKTLKCLETLVDQGISRIILVENSEDGGVTLAAMQRGLDSISEKEVSVAILDNGKNLGFSAGVNIALASKYIRKEDSVLLINSDAHLMPNSLANLISALPAGADIAAPLVAEPGHSPRPPLFYYNRYFALLTRHRIPGSFPYITGACMMISSKVVSSQLFNEKFFFYGEDVMLGATMIQLRKNFTVVKNSIAVHEGSGSAKNGSLFYEYHINRGHWLLARELFPENIKYSAALFFRIFTLTVRAILRSIRLRSTLPLKGFFRASSDFFSGEKNFPNSK